MPFGSKAIAGCGLSRRGETVDVVTALAEATCTCPFCAFAYFKAEQVPLHRIAATDPAHGISICYIWLCLVDVGKQV